MSSVNLKNVITSQVPDHILESYPVFVQFLEAYYEYVNENVKTDITSLRDLDRTLDEFVSHLKNELDLFGDNYTHIDKILLLRKIKQVLVAKGSEAAYKFIFKILFDKPVNITYPWDSVLKASDGKWKRDTSLFIRITEGNPLSIIGSRVTIVGPQRRMFVYVDNIRHVNGDVFEFFIEKSYYGIIEPGNTLEYDGVQGVILPTTVGYQIINPGAGYKVGDVIDSNTVAGGKTITQRIKVTAVDTNGGIKSIVTLRFGYDYTSDFFLYTTTGAVIRKSRFKAVKNGTDQFDLPDDSEITRYQDFGQITKPNYWAVAMSDITYVGTLIQQFYTESQNNVESGEVYALIRFNIGAVAKYQGYYISNDGFLSDNIYLQDSKYYQKYSYLITVDERLEDYKALLMSILHPAGAALFGEYQIQSQYNSSLDVSFELGEYRSAATLVTINIPRLDQTNINDLGGYVDMNPYDLETYYERSISATDNYNIGNATEKDNENPTTPIIFPV